MGADDRQLIEWVARAKPGDRLPDPYFAAQDYGRSIIHRLVELGVMDEPSPADEVAAVFERAGSAARDWLAVERERG